MRRSESCRIVLCPNKRKIPGISYFRITKKRYFKWLEALGWDSEQSDYAYDIRICSAHFQPNDISVTPRGRIVLNPYAVPTLNLGPNVEHRKRTLAQKKALANLHVTQMETSSLYQDVINFNSLEYKAGQEKKILFEFVETSCKVEIPSDNEDENAKSKRYSQTDSTQMKASTLHQEISTFSSSTDEADQERIMFEFVDPTCKVELPSDDEDVMTESRS